MNRYSFLFLMIFISLHAMEQDNALEIPPLSLPNSYEKHSKSWVESLSDWAQCYYHAKALYENANAYQKKEQAEGKSGKSSDRGLLIMQVWLQWCQSTLKQIIEDPNALIAYPFGERFLDVALYSNTFCLGKLLIALNANPCLKSAYTCHSVIFHAKDLKWAQLFASSKCFKPDILDDVHRNLIMRATDYDYDKEVLEFYLNNKIDIHYTNDEGNILHSHIKQDLNDILRFRLNAEDVENQREKAELLIKRGVNINYANKGFTPLDVITQERGYMHIMKLYCDDMEQLLRKYGAKHAEELDCKKRKFTDDRAANVD